MKKYTKPTLLTEEIKLEDICSIIYQSVSNGLGDSIDWSAIVGD